MKKILTVVIPAYNIEKYIENCLDSFVIPEVLEDLEVLIVNDGSKDRSADLAAAYEKRYPNSFRVINKENGGHGSTINRGLLEASGKYFKVVDGDDWVEREAFLRLMDCLKGCTSDVVFSNYYWVREKDGRKKPEFAEPFAGVIYGKEYQFSEISDRIFMKMHGMTMRTEMLRGIPPIDEHCFYVDMEYVLFPVPLIRTVTCIDAVVYMYRVGLPGQSRNMKSMRENAENYDRVLQRLLGFYDEQRQKRAPACVMVYLENIIARMAASRFKIFLSFPCSRKIPLQMREFDRGLLEKYPKIYQAVRNRAVLFLRKTDYRAYYAARLTFKIKEGLKK